MHEAPPTVVLVHGAWTDGSSWNQVIPILQAEGLQVVAAQLPLSSLEEDAAATTRAMADVKGPIVLVGHSWGGIAVTVAGDTPNVVALVYVAAFAPDVGESGGSLIAAHPQPPALSTTVTNSAGFVYQTVDGFVNNVAPDLPAQDAKVMTVTQGPVAAKAFGQTVTAAAWKAKPSWYVLSANDRVVNTELQAAVAKRMRAHTTTLQSGHMSLISHASEVARVIMDAAAQVTAGQLASAHA
jgi:pimeloyl-ACP methyl ester carboxylesterase